MIRRLIHLFYGATPADFESAFGLEESVRRLSAATERSVFAALAHQAAVGRVSKRRVSLQRAIPLLGNAFKPFYVGKLRGVNGRVVLTGHFTMHWWTKAFLTLWLGFGLLWTLVAMLISVLNPHEWWVPLVGIAMCAGGLALVSTGKWLARNDPAWLSNVIRSALSEERATGGSISDAQRLL